MGWREGGRMRASRVALWAALGLAIFTLLGASASPVGAQGDGWTEIGRGRNYIEYQRGSQFRQEIFGGPIFTQADNGDWVSYIFEDLGDRYQVQHPYASIKFFDYYSEIWTENFENVIIYNDQWGVESWQVNKWKDVGFWGIVRSYEIVSDNELRIIRTGETTIGQRKETYIFRQGSPVKISIEQTCDDAETVRFVWKPSGIVATAENINKDNENRASHLTYWDENSWVGSLAWFDEFEVVNNIDVVCETHAQGRKATITFGNFEIGAGENAVLDPTETFYSLTGDGYIYTTCDPTYSSAHDQASGDIINNTALWLKIGQENSATGDYSIWRTFVLFDTSSLPDSAVITGATLSLFGWGDLSSADFDVVVQNGQPTYPHDPLEIGDYFYAHYSGNGGSFNTSGFTTGDYNDITLNENARTNWIRKDNLTKLALRNSNDIDNTAPSGQEYITVYSSDKGSGYQPRLTVSWETALPQPYDLKVEDQTSPQRLTTLTPEFSFIYFDNEGDNMKRWRIQVGTSAGDNSMWDNMTTENAENGATITVTYGGTALSRGVQYHWRARAQDNNDNWGNWSENENFQINQLPTCSITAPPDGYDADVDEGIQFTSSASDPDNDSISSYCWDFGDLAGTSSEANPSYSYSTAGDYTATLYVSDGYENSSVASITVSVGGGAPPPPPPSDGGPGGPMIPIPSPGEIVRDVVEPEKNILFVRIFGIGPLTINPLMMLIALTVIARYKKKRASGIMWALIFVIIFGLAFGSRLV